MVNISGVDPIIRLHYIQASSGRGILPNIVGVDLKGDIITKTFQVDRHCLLFGGASLG